MARKTNPELATEFRALLTDGARSCFNDDGLQATKQYRGDLWRAFAEIEERLDPLGVETRRRLAVGKGTDTNGTGTG